MEDIDRIDPLISVIVPVYNIEDLVSRCVKSLIVQTYRHLEIILVDDGSTDSSGQKLDAFAEVDSRIVVIHKTNGGLSDARNVGISRATGALVTCIDGDDYVTSDYIEVLFKPFEDPRVDLSVVNFKKVLPEYKGEEEQHRKDMPSFEVITNVEGMERLFLQQGITNSAWAKLYRRSVFEGIQYPKGKNFEDLPVTYKLFEKARCIALVNSEAYFYVQHSKSITSTTKFNERVHAIDFAEEAVAFVSERYPTLVPAAKARAFVEPVFLISQVPDLRSLRKLDHSVIACLRRNRGSAFKASPRHKLLACASLGGVVPVWVLMKAITKISNKRISARN